MAKKSANGDSKQGLIIALVCFVLLSIGLGVTAYYGYQDNATSLSKAKQAETDAGTAKKNRDWYKYLYLQLKQYAGHLDPKEASDLTALAGSNLSGDDKEAADKLFATLKKSLVKDNNTAEYYQEKVARLMKELEAAKTQFATTDQQLKKANSQIATMTSDMETERSEWKKKLDASVAQNLKERQDQEKKFESMLAEFGDLNKKIGEVTKKAQEDSEEWAKRSKKNQAQIKQVTDELIKERDKSKPPNLLQFDTPKGKIVRLDQTGEVAFIDIGSADNLRASQAVTFSIFSSSTGGKIGGERKGALEVVDVLSAHLAKAKITEVVDPNRDPIVTGDLLINPAWNSGNQTHVAIAGLIDMTGEGRDEIDEFMRSLKREGIAVDAYLDLRDNEVKGTGMTLKTDYLIVGETPDLFTVRDREFKTDDPRNARKIAIGEKMTDMRKQATELGVTVVPLRRFAMLTGYRLPKGVGVGTGAGYDFIRPGETLNAPEKQPAKKNGKAETKPEKKDDEDKDKDKDK
jgi:hypothetical protein